MSTITQWVGNVLFILSCIFLPWRNLGGSFGGHTATDGHFSGYYLLFTQPDGLALDSLTFMLQLILIGSVMLWTETLIRSNLEGYKKRYVGITLALAIVIMLFPPLAKEIPIAGTLAEIEDVFTGFGFFITDQSAVSPKFVLSELIPLFGLSILAMKYHSKHKPTTFSDTLFIGEQHDLTPINL